MSLRILKVNELIKQQVGQVLQKEAPFKDALITVSQVETAKDLRNSRIYLSVFPFKNGEKIVKNLNERAGFLQSKLYQKLFMKPLPHLRFVLDNSQEKIKEIENLMKIKR